MLSHKPFAERIYPGQYISFLVLNRYEIATVMPEVAYLVISVTDPEREEAVLADSPNCRAVLRLQFHDKGNRRPSDAVKVVMTPKDAGSIIAFVRAHLERV